MATQKNVKQITRQGSNNRGGNDSSYISASSVPSNQVHEDSEIGFIIGFISMVIVFGLLLPIMCAMYLDILETKEETKRQQIQIEKLINQAKDK